MTRRSCSYYLIMAIFYISTMHFLMSDFAYGYVHSVAMGKSEDCDNATAFKIDWDTADTTPYTCSIQDRTLPIPSNIENSTCPYNETKLKETEDEGIREFPKKVNHKHICHNVSIKYGSPYPSTGNHRPAWPKYGVYKYLPPQRWLHTLEHGGIVALYHPCVPEKEKKKFLCLVGNQVGNLTSNFPELYDKQSENVLPMFVATPESKIPTCQPFVLLAWKQRLLMTKVLDTKIKEFIKMYYREGPEKNEMDGDYKANLETQSGEYIKSKCQPDSTSPATK